MVSDRQRAELRSPIRQLLRSAAGMSTRPSDEDLRELEIDDRSREPVREAADQIIEVSDRGGLRARHRAQQMADRLAAEIAAAVPREYAGFIRPEVDDGGDPAELADRMRARRGRRRS